MGVLKVLERQKDLCVSLDSHGPLTKIAHTLTSCLTRRPEAPIKPLRPKHTRTDTDRYRPTRLVFGVRLQPVGCPGSWFKDSRMAQEKAPMGPPNNLPLYQGYHKHHRHIITILSLVMNVLSIACYLACSVACLCVTAHRGFETIAKISGIVGTFLGTICSSVPE